MEIPFGFGFDSAGLWSSHHTEVCCPCLVDEAVVLSSRDAGRELRPGVVMPTKAERRTMIDKAPARWRPFIDMATFSGMRASELRGLLYATLQIENGITVPAVDDAGKPVVDENGKPIMRAQYGLHALGHAAVWLFAEQGWNAKKVQTVGRARG